MTSTTHPDRERWNRRYRESGPGSGAFPTAPAEWLTSHEELLSAQPKGRALDVACGNGRNAVYLARLGFEVDALDISEVAIEWLGEKVRREDLPVHKRWSDLADETLSPESYQVVVNVNYLERKILPALAAALVPGGLLFFQSFTRDHIDVLGRDLDPLFTFATNELLRSFLDLRILEYRDEIIHLNPDSPRSPRAVARLVARKEA